MERKIFETFINNLNQDQLNILITNEHMTDNEKNQIIADFAKGYIILQRDIFQTKKQLDQLQTELEKQVQTSANNLRRKEEEIVQLKKINDQKESESNRQLHLMTQKFDAAQKENEKYKEYEQNLRLLKQENLDKKAELEEMKYYKEILNQELVKQIQMEIDIKEILSKNEDFSKKYEQLLNDVKEERDQHRLEMHELKKENIIGQKQLLEFHICLVEMNDSENQKQKQQKKFHQQIQQICEKYSEIILEMKEKIHELSKMLLANSELPNENPYFNDYYYYQVL